jgi:NitT/TauT family transport system permease protein
VVEAVETGRAFGVLWTSVSRAVLGFLTAVVIATPLGLLIAKVRVVRAAIGSLLTGLQSLPSVAWVPAGILWFGATPTTIYFVVLMGSVPSIANGLVSGVDQIPPLLPRVGQALGAGRMAAARHILLPAALPGYLAGLKQGWAFSWRSLMAAEIIATSPQLGEGLGQYLHNGSALNDISMVIAAIFLILLVGVGIELLVFRPLERAVLRARGLTGAL